MKKYRQVVANDVVGRRRAFEELLLYGAWQIRPERESRLAQQSAEFLMRFVHFLLRSRLSSWEDTAKVPGSVEGLHRERTSSRWSSPIPATLIWLNHAALFSKQEQLVVTQAASQTASAAVKTARKLEITTYLEV